MGITNWDVGRDFIGIWTSDISPALDGDILDVGNVGGENYGNGLAAGTNGVFITTNSTMYVYIKVVDCYGVTFNGSVLINEVNLKEVE